MSSSATTTMSSADDEEVVPTNPPSLTWKTRLMMFAITAASDFACRRDGTINRRLLSFLDDNVPAKPTSSRSVTTHDIPVDPTRNLYFRLFLPTNQPKSPPLPLLVFFHGGGFAFLSPSTSVYDAVCRRLVKTLPAVIVSVNYRLAPEHKAPAPYVDGLDILRFLDQSTSNPLLSLADLSNCFLAGDSAGGNITHHVARSFANEENSFARIKLKGLVIIQPYFGGEERTRSEVMLTKAPLVSLPRTDYLWKAFLPEGADKDHEFSHVFGPNDKRELEEGFPPAMVVVGGWDPLKDWQRKYAEGLRKRGKEVKLVEYPEAVHAFYLFPDLKEGSLMIEEMRAFIQSHNDRP